MAKHLLMAALKIQSAGFMIENRLASRLCLCFIIAAVFFLNEHIFISVHQQHTSLLSYCSCCPDVSSPLPAIQTSTRLLAENNKAKAWPRSRSPSQIEDRNESSKHYIKRYQCGNGAYKKLRTYSQKSGIDYTSYDNQIEDMVRAKRPASNSAQVVDSCADSESEEEKGAVGGGWSPARGKSKKYVCKGGLKVCGNNISQKEDSIMCESCSEWFHPKCQGITIEAFRALTKYDFLWVCMGCKPKVKAMLELGTNLEKKIEMTEKRIVETLNEVKDDKKAAEARMTRFEELGEKVREVKDQQAKLLEAIAEQKAVFKEVPRYAEQLRDSTKVVTKLVDTQKKKLKGKITSLFTTFQNVHQITQTSVRRMIWKHLTR